MGCHISNNRSLSYITSFKSHGDIPWCADTLSPLPEVPQVASERTPAETLPVRSVENNRPIHTLESGLLSLCEFWCSETLKDIPKGKLLQLEQSPVNILHSISKKCAMQRHLHEVSSHFLSKVLLYILSPNRTLILDPGGLCDNEWNFQRRWQHVFWQKFTEGSRRKGPLDHWHHYGYIYAHVLPVNTGWGLNIGMQASRVLTLMLHYSWVWR